MTVGNSGLLVPGGLRRELLAAGYMLFAAVVWGILPLSVELTSGMDSPFLFSAAFRLGGAVACLGFVLVRYWTLVCRLAWSAVSGSSGERRLAGWYQVAAVFSLRSRLGWGLVFLLVFGKYELMVMSYALQAASIYSVALTFELWPFFMVMAMMFLFRGSGLYRKSGVGLLVMMVICFCGVVLVVLAEGRAAAGGIHHLGVGLALAGAILAGLQNSILFKIGSVLGVWFHRARISSESRESLVLFALTGLQALTQFSCFVSSLPVAGLLGERMAWGQFLMAVLVGVAVAGVADVAFRKSNAMTRNLGVNALTYTTPVMSFLWLRALSSAEAVDFGFLVPGMFLIVGANLVIGFEVPLRIALGRALGQLQLRFR